jgi:hypothetical protein
LIVGAITAGAIAIDEQSCGVLYTLHDGDPIESHPRLIQKC